MYTRRPEESLLYIFLYSISILENEFEKSISQILISFKNFMRKLFIPDTVVMQKGKRNLPSLAVKWTTQKTEAFRFKSVYKSEVNSHLFLIIYRLIS